MASPWIIFSFIAFLTSLFVDLLVRKIHLNNVPLRIQNSAQCILPLLGFSVWGLLRPGLFKIDSILIFLIMFFAVVFTLIGTILSNKAITLAKNPGYAIAITRINVLIVTLAAILLFGSYLSWITFISVLIIIFSSFLCIDYSGKGIWKTAGKSNLWLWYALGAGILTSGYALGSKFFINENIPLLARMFYAFLAMSAVQVVYLFIKTKIVIRQTNISLLLMLGISTFLFNIFVQLAFERAPNPGFVNAILAGAIIPVTLFAAYFFHDEFNKRKIFGVLGILTGPVLLYLHS